MDYIGLVQVLHRDSGVGGVAPVTVTGATGIMLRLVNGINEAWLRIQNHPKEWKWMWGDYPALYTVINTQDYVLTTVKSIHKKTFRSYLKGTGVSDRQQMIYMDYEKFQNAYGIVDASADRPLVATQLPNDNLRLYPPPDGIYTIEFEYQKKPQVLVSDTDVPDMPSEFHQLIVYDALKHYGYAEDAPETINLAAQLGGHDGSGGQGATGMWRSLIWDQEVRRREHMVVVPE